jgi:predicted nucleic acid-binding Zn ribbon protein
MTIKHCIACNKELINRRPQTKTCNDACRAKHWRQTRVTKLPVSFMLNIANYALIKKASESAGVTINQYAHDQLVQIMEAHGGN